MALLTRFPEPFRVRCVDAETLETLGQLSQALKGFSARQSWADDSHNRYFPLSPWLGDSDGSLVLVRDGDTRKFQELLLMTRAQAWVAGMPYPKIIEIGVSKPGDEEDV